MIFAEYAGYSFTYVGISLLIAFCSIYFTWIGACLMWAPSGRVHDREDYIMAMVFSVAGAAMVFVLWPIIPPALLIGWAGWRLSGRLVRRGVL